MKAVLWLCQAAGEPIMEASAELEDKSTFGPHRNASGIKCGIAPFLISTHGSPVDSLSRIQVSRFAVSKIKDSIIYFTTSPQIPDRHGSG